MISHFPFEMRFSYLSTDRGLVLKTRGILDPEIDNGYHTIEGKEEEMNTWKSQKPGEKVLSFYRLLAGSKQVSKC